ncbi:hypothetical protein PFICI_08162 [Pestalotiopsis fici W106-1]|uniref:Uncharacterized protein n=1 Tax=Pestalotiopsis fici (strain W106-1 / CGMCC3.15140) TaxID=1229662 RepID=W3X3C1_PESFW|nr:uncharacterized protein PFICI_08162 [Pestalotiopsis fici W106-1]ETS80633.1 hypothetical protein PFICI_08162 [Pestalotiopsis fici W106-1]
MAEHRAISLHEPPTSPASQDTVVHQTEDMLTLKNDPSSDEINALESKHTMSTQARTLSNDSRYHEPASRSTKLQRTWLFVLTAMLATIAFAVVIIFVLSTYFAERASEKRQQLNNLMKVDASMTLSVLRASQGLLSVLMGLLLEEAFTLLQWDFLNRPNGLPYTSILILSPTTTAAGIFALAKSSVVAASAKCWAVLRLFLIAVVWLSGLVLFFNTSITTVYDTAYTYPVTAGVGPFNGSLVAPFKEFLHSLRPGYPYETLPYTYFAAAYTLVINPLLAVTVPPANCTGESCSSYLFSGGLEMVVPWVPQSYKEHSLVKVEKTPSIQVDFSSPIQDDPVFQDSDCDVFGQTGIAIGIRLCLDESPQKEGWIRAALYTCSRGIDNGSCTAHVPRPNITAEVSFYTLQTSLVASRLNYSILGVFDSTQPAQIYDLDLPAYRESLRWLLNFTAADLPAPSAIAQSFWGSQMQLSDPSTWGILAQNFQSILVFPFWLFNANNWGNTELKENVTVSTLPPDFYTQASLIEPYSKLDVDDTMFAIFLGFQSLAMGFVLCVLVWIWTGSRVPPKMSSFPLFDLSFRTERCNEVEIPNVAQADNSDIIQGVKDVRLMSLGVNQADASRKQSC